MAEQIQKGAPRASLNEQVQQVQQYGSGISGSSTTSATAQTTAGVIEGEEGLRGRKIVVSITYNVEEIKKALVVFVIKDEMPFSVVEGREFCYFVNRLEPKFPVPSRRTITRDCYQLFLDEKGKLKECLKKSCVRACLTIDCWTSIQNISYMCLTIHFIDEH
ncbi:hypothetical protein L6164_016657 [Bauhinia variegata]|uniref:Uncharacterized protein n=1 Tax=Bauhinia variegata TaxID=167791 RepID=A0ACB9NQ27_BAUVA|nr:hypothetical protein L6164_016657 [Bauhinia variegata]